MAKSSGRFQDTLSTLKGDVETAIWKVASKNTEVKNQFGLEIKPGQVFCNGEYVQKMSADAMIDLLIQMEDAAE